MPAKLLECPWCGLERGAYDGPITPEDVVDLAARLTVAYDEDREGFESLVEQARGYLESDRGG